MTGQISFKTSVLASVAIMSTLTYKPVTAERSFFCDKEVSLQSASPELYYTICGNFCSCTSMETLCFYPKENQKNYGQNRNRKLEYELRSVSTLEMQQCWRDDCICNTHGDANQWFQVAKDMFGEDLGRLIPFVNDIQEPVFDPDDPFSVSLSDRPADQDFAQTLPKLGSAGVDLQDTCEEPSQAMECLFYSDTIAGPKTLPCGYLVFDVCYGYHGCACENGYWQATEELSQQVLEDLRFLMQSPDEQAEQGNSIESFQGYNYPEQNEIQGFEQELDTSDSFLPDFPKDEDFVKYLVVAGIALFFLCSVPCLCCVCCRSRQKNTSISHRGRSKVKKVSKQGSMPRVADEDLPDVLAQIRRNEIELESASDQMIRSISYNNSLSQQQQLQQQYNNVQPQYPDVGQPANADFNSQGTSAQQRHEINNARIQPSHHAPMIQDQQKPGPAPAPKQESQVDMMMNPQDMPGSPRVSLPPINRYSQSRLSHDSGPQISAPLQGDDQEP